MAKQPTEAKAAERKTCFIIMPISTPPHLIDDYRDRDLHFRHVLDLLMVPAVERAGYKPLRPIAQGADLIHAEIIKNLQEADLVLCDMSALNANVFFELGIRTALNKPVCLVRDDLTKKVPFDTSMINHHDYRGALDSWELEQEIKALVDHLEMSATRSAGGNALWKYFGLTTVAKPAEGTIDATDANHEMMLSMIMRSLDSLNQRVDGLLDRAEHTRRRAAFPVRARSSELSHHSDNLLIKLNEWLPNNNYVKRISRSESGEALVVLGEPVTTKDIAVLEQRALEELGERVEILPF